MTCHASPSGVLSPTLRVRLIVLLAVFLSACSDATDLPTVPAAVAFNKEGEQPNILTAEPENSLLRVGETLQLVARIKNKNGVVQPDRPIKFRSSDPAVAAVSESGLITALRPGIATITASSGGGKPLTAVAEVTVGPTVAIGILPFIDGATTLLGAAPFAVVGDYPHVAYSCKINGAETNCDSPLRWNDLALMHGDLLTIEVTATDLDAASPLPGVTAVAQATIDARAPTITNLSILPGARLGPNFVVSFSSDETLATVSCSLDGAPFDCQPEVLIDFFAISHGLHSLDIITSDLLGNTNSVSTAFSVDALGPIFDPSLTRVPEVPVAAESTLDTEIRFRAFDPTPASHPISYECSLDGALLGPCSDTSSSGGVFRWSGLTPGQHSLTVIPYDGFRNAGASLEVDFVVDTGS